MKQENNESHGEYKLCPYFKECTLYDGNSCLKTETQESCKMLEKLIIKTDNESYLESMG